MLRKIVRFRCFTNIHCWILVLHLYVRKTYPLVKLTVLYRNEIYIEKIRIYAAKNRKIQLLHEYLLRDFGASPLQRQNSPSC